MKAGWGTGICDIAKQLATSYFGSGQIVARHLPLADCGCFNKMGGRGAEWGARNGSQMLGSVVG